MSIDVDNAIATRWTNAGLDASVGTLYPGQETPSPEGTALPRANYYSPSDTGSVESRGSVTKMKTYVFEAWGATYEAAGACVRSIAAALFNSEFSASHPLQMDAHIGHIMSTHEMDQGVEKLNDSMFRGWYELMVRWTKPKVVP